MVSLNPASEESDTASRVVPNAVGVCVQRPESATIQHLLNRDPSLSVYMATEFPVVREPVSKRINDAPENPNNFI